MNKTGLFFLALVMATSVAKGQQSEKRDPLKWSAGNTTAKIGGFVHVMVATDFGGAINNEEFIPAYAPVQQKWANENNFQISPNYSRLYLDVVQKTDLLGDVKVYIETDFRGVSSALRLRKAYISAKGLLIGQDNSIAEDQAAMAPSINTQGSNSRSHLRSPQITYRHNFDHGFSVAASIEKPVALIFTNKLLEIDNLSDEVSELTNYLGAATQTIPDCLAYLQNKGDVGHLRLVGIYRNLSYHNLCTTTVERTTGYGFSANGSLNLSSRVRLYSQGIYGKGIGRYINDIARSLIDLSPSTDEHGAMGALPMWGASVGMSADLGKDFSFSTTLSRAEVRRTPGYELDVMFKRGDYLATTLFYSPLNNMSLGMEYLFGSHINMGGDYAQSNRMQIMARYSF